MKAFEKDRARDNTLIPRTPTMIEKDLLVSREHLAFLGSFHNSLTCFHVLCTVPLLWPVSIV